MNKKTEYATWFRVLISILVLLVDILTPFVPFTAIFVFILFIVRPKWLVRFVMNMIGNKIPQ